MKTIYKLGMLFVFAGMFFACSEEYLETSPSQFTNVATLNEIAEFDPGVFDGVLAGVYATMHQQGSGGTTGHDDIGHRGYDIFTDMMSSDMVLGALNYGWYRGIADYTWIEDQANNRNYIPWRFYYRLIFGANSVIEAQGGNDFVPETPAQGYVLGQAKALRAFGYFYLTQLLQNEYNPSQKLLPMMVTPEIVNREQSTNAEIFQLIEDDLNFAVQYLDGYNRDARFQINKYIAEGILAYTYAAQGKYDQALTAAADIVQNSGVSPVKGDALTGGFNDVGTPGWMWGIDCTPDMGLNLLSWFGQMDVFTYSYAWAGDPKLIDSDLYAQMPDTDYRKAQFDSDLRPTGKFYNPDRAIGGSSADNNEMDYLYMRVSEFHLLAAESAYKTGDSGTAKNYLKNFMELRVPNASYVDNLSGDDLMAEISLQTRLEFWGEGKSYLLMKRNKETRTRGDNHVLLPGQTFTYNEDRLTFKIPLSEIQNNPFID